MLAATLVRVIAMLVALTDLDGFAVGPREWDLVLTALYFERFGWHTAEEYAAFVETYGYDVMAWDGYPGAGGRA